MREKSLHFTIVGSVDVYFRNSIVFNFRRVTQNQYTPLHWACIRDHKDVAAMLVESGASVEVVDAVSVRYDHS